MKKLPLMTAMLLLLAAPTFSFAEQKAKAHKKSVHDEMSGQGYGTAGCGLGSIVFGQKPGLIQVVAATLNGTFGSQTFGISSGTSNCQAPSGDSTASAPYIEANRVALANDIARGNGETLNNLSAIYGCQDMDKVGQTLQQNFERIFPAQNVPATQVEKSIKEVLIQNKLCHKLG